jgi:alkanesulfonate monooxygenase SsuD/methylene tetrahydromethanopterin reductase-like flavin-dependent oxidoreductase (luciferase family)
MLPLHHPVDTAHRIAMLDHRARGRFSWGIGVRSLQTDLHLYGVDSHAMDDVRERGKEALEVKPAAMAGVAGFPFVGGPWWSVVGRGDGKRCRRLRCGTTQQEDDNASSF